MHGIGVEDTCFAETGSGFLGPSVNNDWRFENRFSHRKSMMVTMYRLLALAS